MRKRRQNTFVTLSNREIETILSALMRVMPKLIHEYSRVGGLYYCPHCYAIVDVEYQKHCRSCGQRLKWYGYRKYGVCINRTEAEEKRRAYTNAIIEYQEKSKKETIR
jgi:hypothetical protein